MVDRPFDGLRTGVGHVRVVLQAANHLHGEIAANLNLAREPDPLAVVRELQMRVDVPPLRVASASVIGLASPSRINTRHVAQRALPPHR